MAQRLEPLVPPRSPALLWLASGEAPYLGGDEVELFVDGRATTVGGA